MFAADGTETPRSLAEGELSGIGGAGKLEFHDAEGRDIAGGGGTVTANSMPEALATVEQALERAGLQGVDAVGYRVVHPGPRLKGHQRITPEVMAELKGAARFAPLHDPVAVELIEEMMRRMPQVPHFACFDTVFHETIPEVARTYALPEEVRTEGVRRYGFHGLSCESIVQEMKALRGDDVPTSFVIAHLGSGCSVTAVVKGVSVYTTMGLTPTGGVVMGTRPGDLDPGVMLYLLRRKGATVESVEGMVNRESGLKALGGANDMRELRRRASGGGKDAEAAQQAIAVFCESVSRAVAAELVMASVDALVFTGGIGQHDDMTRGAIAKLLRKLGAEIDAAENGKELSGAAVRKISSQGSRVAMYAARPDEDGMIARHVVAMCSVSQREPENQP